MLKLTGLRYKMGWRVEQGFLDSWEGFSFAIRAMENYGTLSKGVISFDLCVIKLTVAAF